MDVLSQGAPGVFTYASDSLSGADWPRSSQEFTGVR